MNQKKRTTWKSVLLIVLILLVSMAINTFIPDNRETNSSDYHTYSETSLHFRNEKLLHEHFEKHGIEMGFKSESEYENAASNVVSNTEALHKTEAEDGDDVYYLEKTNEFVIVSTDGYLRTYFYPNDGINYFNRQ